MFNDIKEWTLLIYNNGNNEMSPEIYRSFINSKKCTSTKNINIVTQIGKANNMLVTMVNPSKIIPKEIHEWSGVRRYIIMDEKEILIQDMGFLNMADPKTLYNFIKWGIVNFPAKHYMLLVSGHGISYIGGLTDITLDNFYIMGIPEMCYAINLIKKDYNISIDVLVLDMCYMNLIEVIYELGYKENHTCKKVITYSQTGPLSGISICHLINFIEENIDCTNLNLFIEKLLNNLNFPLICYTLDSSLLKIIKEHFSELANCYLSLGYKNPVDIFKIMTDITNKLPCNIHLKEINSILSSIVYTNDIINKNFINIICTNLNKSIIIYKKLAFAQNNKWCQLLSNYNIENTTKNSLLAPTKLSNGAIYSFLSNLNPNLSSQEILKILSNLKTYNANYYRNTKGLSHNA
ncbi:hypothetical protein BD780_002949 [Clostridium tetanomorphum]|uniref:Clostripain n=1 Tax=Clostridium tetanomorphum TaxID=1553 RepID=A0A923EB80_CLOTT|nr:clostripain-related cysteine peptidase [Clostridium tetanomorphum]KAJ53708.1 alpha-clostripain-like protein [Clostridium tetanomorphum DSM 665]MBC2397220.1 clostripain [Clostridium tetanomorphum]MBP1862436.1 hypothetical protein [Clostridium tetanomorphum]NRS85724.1 hypothetical protein [Clostridium tetanomorphum]NRZ96267.1 hypothetical protein [Clostridium tetanomorphum]